MKCLKEGIHLFTNEDVVSTSGVIEFKTLQWEKQVTHGGHVHDLPLHSKFFTCILFGIIWELSK